MPLAPLKLSSQGLRGFKDPSQFTTGALLVATNVDFAEGSTLQKEPGSVRLTTAAINGSAVHVTGGTEYRPTATAQRRVVGTADGKLYKDDMTATFATTLASGLSAPSLPHFTVAGQEDAGNDRKLFIANGIDPVKVVIADAATANTIASPHADWATKQPRVSIYYGGTGQGTSGGQLIAGAGSYLYGSLSTDHEDFVHAGTTPDFNTMAVYPTDNSLGIFGLVRAFGRLFIFKAPRGIYMIQTPDPSDSTTWYPYPISDQYGIPTSPHAVTQITDGRIMFINFNGSPVLMTETADTVSGIGFVDLGVTLGLSTLIRDQFEPAYFNSVQTAWYDDKKQFHALYVARDSGTTFNRRLVLDFNLPEVRPYIVDKDTAQSIWLEQDSTFILRPTIGDNVGHIWRLDQEARNVNGSAYSTTIQTAPTDFSDLKAEFQGFKNFKYLHVEFESLGDWDVNIYWIVDGKEYGPLPFNQSAENTTAASGGSTTFPFTFPAVFEGTALRRRVRKIAGSGMYFALRIEHSGDDENFRIPRAWVEFDLTKNKR